MRVFYGFSRFHHPFRKTIAALGVFDGVHRGHQKILQRILHRAHQKKGASLLITFDPHPVKVLRPRKFLPLLTCLPHRLKLLRETGLDACLILPFTRSFSKWSAEAFVKKLLVDRLKVTEVGVGFDLAFGRDRKGDISLLRRAGRQYGFRVFQVGKVSIGRERVSSSRIRRLIAEGDLSKGARFLGRDFSIHGKVVRGSGRGVTLGAPTANLRLCEQILPPVGVYAVWVRPFFATEDRTMNTEQTGTVPTGCWGLLNLGTRPTFSPTRKKSIAEIHLLDFNGTLTGKELEAFLLRKIRSERKFQKPEALARQIRKDVKKVKGWIARRQVVPPA